jgi:competence/damage-inducible protein CinA-like protein
MQTRVHRTAAVVSIGDEIVRGEKLDTNSAWIAARLTDRGIEVCQHATADDETDAIARILADLRKRFDLALVTGGLGPTADDLTRQGLAQAAGTALVEDARSLTEIQNWFERTNRPMPRLNRVQAMKPDGAICITNHCGTAPGLMLPGDDKGGDVFCLPGPPDEMQPMFDWFVADKLNPAADRAVATRLIHTIGIGEANVAQRLGQLMQRGRNPVVGTTASGGIVTCRLRFTGAGAGAELDALEREVRQHLGVYVFGAGDETIAQVLIDLLRKRNGTLAVVESCTGGLLGAAITAVAGASDVFKGGWITYADAMKTAQVAVPPEVLARDGAVSKATAEAMARGGLIAAGATCCAAITGVAGPSGGTDDKPVGTVWIAVASKEPGDTSDAVRLDARRFYYPTQREGVRRSSVVFAMAMIRLALLESDENHTRLLFEQESSQTGERDK